MPIDHGDYDPVELPPLSRPFPPIEMPPNADDWDPMDFPASPNVRRALEDGEYEIVSVEVVDIKRAESDLIRPLQDGPPRRPGRFYGPLPG